MSFVRKHIKAYCLLFFHVVEQMLSGWLVASRHSWRNLRMRMYRIHSRDFLVLCEQYMSVSLTVVSSGRQLRCIQSNWLRT
jgi:hypothetical protein